MKLPFINFFFLISFFFFWVPPVFSSQTSKVDSLLRELDSLNRIPATMTSDSHRLEILFNLSYYFKHNAPEKTVAFGNQAFEIAAKTKNKTAVARALYFLGVGNYYLGNYDKALQSYLQSLPFLEKAEKSSDAGKSAIARNEMAQTYHDIGKVFYRQNQFKKALEYYFLAEKLFERIKAKQGISSCYSNIAGIYVAQNNLEKALRYLNKSLEIAKEMKDDSDIAARVENIGIIYKKLGKNDKALVHFRQSLVIREKIHDEKGLAYSYLNIGAMYSELGQIQKSLEYLNKGLETAKRINIKERIKDAYDALTKVSAKDEKFREAYEYFLLYSNMKDSLLNETTSRQIAEMQTKYESEKKEKEVLLLQKDKQIQLAEVKKQRILRNSFIAASMLALLLSFVLLNRYQIKRRANNLLKKQNEQIRQQKELIERQKQDITDSIEYASNIQMAMLPSPDEIKKMLPECFVLYKPKAIVSGDFYYLTPLPLQAVAAMAGKGLPPLQMERGIVSSPHLGGVRGGLLLCTADCTGHGVPGAFMSMLCTALLNETVNDNGITSPEKVFEEVRKGVISALKQRGRMGEAKDGMDASLISIEFGNAETQCVVPLQIACANNPVCIVSNGELKEFKPDRFPVGIYEREQKPFTLHTVSLHKGDMIYTMTDGFEDQLGGSPPLSPQMGGSSTVFMGKKFKSKRLKELLLSIAKSPVAEQKEILEKTFDDWKGAGEQTDDVTIIGIRI